MFCRILTASIAIVGLASALNDKEEFMKETKKLACYIYKDMEFYDLQDLEKDTPYQHVQNGITYKWNFCRFDALCPNNPTETLATIQKNANDCSILSGTGTGSIDEKLVKVGNSREDSIFLTYTGGDVCPSSSTTTMSMEIQLVRDHDKEYQFESLDADDLCKPVVTIKSKHGCPVFSPTAIVAFMSKNPWLVGIVLIVFGAIVCFVGRKFFQWTLAAIGFLLGCGVSLLLFSMMGLLDGLETS